MKVLAVFLCVAVSSALAEQYLGCYKDDGARVMVKSTMQSINQQTINGCINRCRGMKYAFAGLQWRRECFCGNDFTRLGKGLESDCNLKCTGNQQQNCGGNWRLSVYATDLPAERFENAYGTFRLFKYKVNAATAKAVCERLGDNWGLAEIPHSVVLNNARPGLATLKLPVTTECWIAGKTSKNHHAKLSNADLPNDSGAQNRIVSNWPNQAQVWNIYAKTGNGARFYICQNFKAEDLGCWKDDSARVMERSTMQSIGNQSSKQCVYRCLAMGFPYCGTQYSRECFCGRDFTRLGEADNCNMNCSGDNKEKCGGGWALSVYKTGLPTPCELIGN